MTRSATVANPLDVHVRRRRIVEVTSAVLVIAALFWCMQSFSPTERSAVPDTGRATPALEGDATSDDQALSPLDLSVFTAARIWNPIPSEIDDKKQDTPAPVKRPSLELVGIIEEHNGERYAAIYHPERQEVLIVRTGDRIEPYLVAAITGDAVRLEDGRAIASLSVRRVRQ